MNRTGREAEDLALAFLNSRGLRLIERNYATRQGEIDLVMEDRGTLAFVEVRHRNSARFGGAIESVDRRKQGRLIKAAEAYLQAHPLQANRPCRFDIIGMGPDQGKIEWIQDAFGK